MAEILSGVCGAPSRKGSSRCLLVRGMVNSVMHAPNEFTNPLPFSLGPWAVCLMSCRVEQPSPESLKKVLDGKVALMEGEQERPLPGVDAEGAFCVSLSKLLHLDEARLCRRFSPCLTEKYSKYCCVFAHQIPLRRVASLHACAIIHSRVTLGVIRHCLRLNVKWDS